MEIENEKQFREQVFYITRIFLSEQGILRQALDEAMLGLHGMNKDFPNETWESRQAYLDATIAGINDTLSLLK